MTTRLVIYLAYSLVALVIVLAASSTSAHAKSSPTPVLRRYALIVGSNTGGGAGRDVLRYAGHDAARVADVLRQLGGVHAPDLALLQEPDRRALDTAFDALSKRVRAERKRGQRVELVVYYSGHADDTGILIGGNRYDYARLRQRIRAVPADVHIAIVDSCASGSFTRIKGGTKLPPFLRDSANQVAGFAFLSSSSADEDAQESDRIAASFFTYFFVAALRGAADRNRDGRVTLTEAYQFSYDHTLGRTRNTAHGPQHPAYEMHLSGTGDIVITDLRSTESTLVLPSALRGRVTIVDASGRVAVELTKEAGEPLSLALPTETYTVSLDSKDGGFEATVTLDRVGTIELAPDAFRRVPRERTAARGLAVEARDDDDDDDDDERGRRTFELSFGGGLRLERPSGAAMRDEVGAILTLGGTSRDVAGSSTIGTAGTADLYLGATLGDDAHFVYDVSVGIGPGLLLGDNLQLGSTIGFGFSGITGVLDFAWKFQSDTFAVFHVSPELRAIAYFRQNQLYSSDARQDGSSIAWWGDEVELGGGLRFGARLQSFLYGSLREMANERYWGVGLGAIF